MRLGFVSAIFPEWTLDEVLGFAAREGFGSVELMCWPPGKADRRYAGVTHLDVTDWSAAKADAARQAIERHGVAISALGYYPNLLQADRDRARVEEDHLRRVIDAASDLGIGVVTSFVGRDPALTVEGNWPRFVEVWTPLIAHAEGRGIRVAIENCPMSFTADEWPGGKNLASSPAIWRKMYEAIPSPNFGLNFDPSHFVFQGMDYVAPMAEFKDRLIHIHAKDVRVDVAKRNEYGVLAYPNLWHTPKLPGMGDVAWGPFLGALADAGYDGDIAVEVEDRAHEGTLARRENALRISRRFLLQFISG